MAATPTLFAGPRVPDQLSNYILLGATGCQNGAFNVTDFSFSFISGNVTILSSDITVTPFSGTDFYGLDFTSPKFNLEVKAATPDIDQKENLYKNVTRSPPRWRFPLPPVAPGSSTRTARRGFRSCRLETRPAERCSTIGSSPIQPDGRG